MCYSPMKIKATGAAAPTFAFVPCGVCDECRRLQKSGWSFRLGLELQQKLNEGWEIGFCTLTYAPEHLPTIPKMCFKNEKEYKEIACFDKHELQKFIRQLRSRMANKYNITGLIYFIGSEYGKKSTKRSHYHMLVCYPRKTVKKGIRQGISAKEMHGEIVDLWQHKGFIFPEKYDGSGRGYSENEEQKPFKVDSSIGAYKCAKYACKYVCKDLFFEKTIDGVEFVDRSEQGERIIKRNCFGEIVYKDGIPDTETAYKVLLRCKPFHLQSRSLGWSFFENMCDSDKLTAIHKGISFLQEEYNKKLPRYIKNKLIFNNKYIFKEVSVNGEIEEKRLCRREPNEFFQKYRDLIYKYKVDGYQKLFESIQRKDYWLTRGAQESDYKYAVSAMSYLKQAYKMNDRQFTETFVSLFKVPKCRCYDVEPSRQWFGRFWQDYLPYDDDGVVADLLDSDFLDDVNDVFSCIFFCLGNLSTQDSEIIKKVDKYKQRKKDD